MTVDQKSYDLAEAFLADHPDHTKPEVMDLAETIQGAVEDWIDEMEERQKIEPTCLHAKRGLCLACYREYLEDPTAWAEYGYHPQGQANTRALLEEIKAERVALPDPFSEELPF